MEEAPSPIRRAVFNESVRRYLADVSFDYSLIEKSHAQAEEWINSNPSAQIVLIQTFHMHACNHGGLVPLVRFGLLFQLPLQIERREGNE